MASSRVSRVARTLAIVLLISGLGMAAASCLPHRNVLEGGRPPDAVLVKKGRAGAGLLGGGGWERLFVSDLPFDSVVTRYRATSQARRGTERPTGADGFRFDTDGDCLYIKPWHDGNDIAFPSRGLTTEELDKINESEYAFVEFQPDDCQYNP